MPPPQPGFRRLLFGLALGAVLLIFGGLALLSAAVNGGLANPSTIYFAVIGSLLSAAILVGAWLIPGPRPLPVVAVASAPPAAPASALPPRKDEDA